MHPITQAYKNRAVWRRFLQPEDEVLDGQKHQGDLLETQRMHGNTDLENLLFTPFDVPTHSKFKSMESLDYKKTKHKQADLSRAHPG